MKIKNLILLLDNHQGTNLSFGDQILICEVEQLGNSYETK